MPRSASPPSPLAPEDLRWQCRLEEMDFATTAEVEPLEGIIGQETAVEALRFGLETTAPGQNVFVRGLAGSGRLTLVRELLEEIRPPRGCAPDRAYVHSFSQPDRPRLLTVGRGRANELRDRVDDLIEFIRADLAPSLNSDVLRERRAEIERQGMEELSATTGPFEKELEQNGLALVRLQVGTTERQAIVPVIDGQPLGPEEFDALLSEGNISEEDAVKIRERIDEHRASFDRVALEAQSLRAKNRERMRTAVQEDARQVMETAVDELLGGFAEDEVEAFLAELVDDLVTRRLDKLEEGDSFLELYCVNPILHHAPDEACPVIVENYPNYERLVGGLDTGRTADGTAPLDHMAIQAGALLRADGGYLILDARDVVENGAAWAALMRTLRSGSVEIAPPEGQMVRGPIVKPESIPVRLKVVLIGGARVYAALDAMDSDFPHLFKVLADFDSTIDRDATGERYYAGFLARLAQNEQLPAFDRDAVAALTEHGGRVAARAGKLTTRLGRIADIAREAAHLATRTGCEPVTAGHVHDAIQRTKRRADLPSRKFREQIARGTIRVNVDGEAVGEVNGLATTQAGPLRYGFPVRLTATMNPGKGGTVNIEGEADLSGSIHTKGFHILGGLLRHLLRGDHPLVFDASIAFEQSYGGIDGDSASGAEMCCLLSALTQIPVRQSFAMTGAIDQVGNILPIGAVNEKIEGFFDVCRDIGLTGEQGVIVPRANAGDLMLREDVVEACRAGQFRVHAVDTILEAVELFTGVEAGERDADGQYGEGTLLRIAADRARAYWEIARTGGST
ncbi:MAG: AAA family ATPase [bacterium]|nr:AAA family ATPase [bacterium]